MCPVFNRQNRKNDRAVVRSNVGPTASLRVPRSRRKNTMQLELLEARQLLASITVNTAVDNSAPDTTLSLRQAIEVSNGTLLVSSLTSQEQALVSGAVGATNTIGFSIPTTDSGFNPAAGVWTIALQSALPTISTNAAIINGYSQTGAVENTLAQADNAKLTIAINGSGGAPIGLTIAQEGSQVFGLDIENFAGEGVLITAGGNVQVAGSFIGTDPTGETAAPNGTGVVLENSFNTIGGPVVGDRNVISGNNQPGEGDGVEIPENNPLNITPTGIVVENNFIGIDAAGTKALANGQAGVADFGSGNTYGGTTAGLGNVISGNAAGGLKSTGSITILGNFVGTDATGNVALGNGSTGNGGLTIEGGASAAVTVTITNNLVSGNKQSGISVSPGSQSLSKYSISNNFIGTNAAGTAALGNGLAGLALSSVENTTVLNNLISGNQVGITLEGFGTDVEHDVFQGNKIGSDITGLVALGNTEEGVFFESAVGTLFGGTGPGQGNLVAFNDGDGIEVYAGKQDQITQNSIFANTGVGIDLTAGANLNPSAPVLTVTPGSGMLSGTLEGTTGVSYVVEIFSNPTIPTPGQELGKTFVQDVTVVPTSGVGTFSVIEPAGTYTANATDPVGDTSRFSNAVELQTLPATTTTVTSTLNPSTVGQQVTFTAVVTAPGFQGTPTGTVTFTIDGQAKTPVSLAVVGGSDQAQFSTSTLTAGPHTVSAAFSGDASLSPSSGTLPTQTVNAAGLDATTTTLVSSANPSNAEQQVIFTATVAPTAGTGTPTGTVTFTIDGTPETPVALQVVSGQDQASFRILTLSVGTHTISASFSGDSTFAASTVASPLSQVVNILDTDTTITSSENPSTVGDQVTFTAIVSPIDSDGTPTGTVTFTIDGHVHTPPVALSLVGNVDQAQLSISTFTAGQHTVSAIYNGDPIFSSSLGMLPTQSVNPAIVQATTTTLTSSSSSSTVGQGVTFTAVVTASGPAGTPTGTVTFTIDGVSETPVPPAGFKWQRSSILLDLDALGRDAHRYRVLWRCHHICFEHAAQPVDADGQCPGVRYRTDRYALAEIWHPHAADGRCAYVQLHA